ncbi:MAG: flavin reductase [Longimicrobiales bacterium]|nr:flavin reductase [Longimicrobiales bacterium]
MDRTLQERGLVSLELSSPVWERFFLVAPLAVVGTVEPDGSPDLAPKHMVTPLGWGNHVGFVCAPAHATYRNAVRTGEFTLTFPRPEAVLTASLSAAPRCDGREKPSLDLLETFPARAVSAPLAEGGYLYLECALHGTWDDFGENSLVAGRIVAAHVSQEGVRRPDVDDAELLAREPLLAYVAPGRYATVARADAFPVHRGTRR